MGIPTKSKTMWDPTSARFGGRLPFDLPVRLSTDGRALGRGIIRNASLSGALIETALDLPLHTNLVVKLTIPGNGAPSPRELAACVVRVDPAGVGIEWRDMASVDVTDLLERARGTDANSPS
jgi:hypothetical protein